MIVCSGIFVKSLMNIRMKEVRAHMNRRSGFFIMF